MAIFMLFCFKTLPLHNEQKRHECLEIPDLFTVLTSNISGISAHPYITLSIYSSVSTIPICHRICEQETKTIGHGVPC